jgi:hypothetical protein
MTLTLPAHHLAALHTLIISTDTVTHRLHITQLLKAILHATPNAHSTPSLSPLHTLVPQTPDVVAASDASKMGMGGF